MSEINLFDAAQEILDQLDKADLLDVWNRYCADYGYEDDSVYVMEEFNAMFESTPPLQIIWAIEELPEYDSDIWWYNRMGNIQFGRIDDIGEDYDDSPVNLGYLADCIVKRRDPMGIPEVEDLLDAEPEEEPEVAE